MQNERVYVAIGSNIDPRIHVPSCINRLSNEECIEIVSISSFYESPAEGRPDQPNYRNGVVQLATSHEPEALKYDVLRTLEELEGRVRTSDRYAPRTIDLDIVLFGERTSDHATLPLPDTAIWQYPFVTIPLLEIAPDLVIPGTRERLADRVRHHPEHDLVLDVALTQTVQKGFSHG